jgi:hypothetical protein
MGPFDLRNLNIKNLIYVQRPNHPVAQILKKQKDRPTAQELDDSERVSFKELLMATLFR